MNITSSNPWKYFFPAALAILDAGLTLGGQPPSYWDDYTNAMELAPQFSLLLQVHPSAFLAGVGGWIYIILLLIRSTPTWPSLLISLMFTLGHGFGATTWLLYHYNFNYFFLFLFFPVLAAITIIIVINEKLAKKGRQRCTF